eukprot:Awhi_evm1s4927
MKLAFLSLGLFLATAKVSAVCQTCSQFFAAEGQDICEQTGFGDRRSPLVACQATHCRLLECCEPPAAVVCRPQTCGEFYGVEGRNVCANAGYDLSKSDFVTCQGLKCQVGECCDHDDSIDNDDDETCEEYFDKKGKIHEDTECDGECKVSECCKHKVETCQDYFDEKGKSYCVDHGYEHRRDHSTPCDKDGCSRSQCCKDKVPQPPQVETCQDYFDDKGKDVCTRRGYEHRRNHSTECSKKGCSSRQCCKGKQQQPTTTTRPPRPIKTKPPRPIKTKPARPNKTKPVKAVVSKHSKTKTKATKAKYQKP